MANVILISDIVLSFLCLLWLLIASLQDIKKREVYNWLSFSLIIFALAIRAMASVIELAPNYFLFGLLGLAVSFAVANAFYYSRIFAGGDAKLLIALGTALSTSPLFAGYSGLLPFEIPFFGVFIINMFFIGAIYGVAYSLGLAVKRRKEFAKEFVKMVKSNKITLVLLSVFCIGLIIFYSSNNLILNGILLLLILPFFFIFVKSVENACLVRKARPKELAEGDWIIRPIKIKKELITPHWEGLSKKEIQKIRNARIKFIVIKEGIPFVPVFLISLLISYRIDMISLIISLIS